MLTSALYIYFVCYTLRQIRDYIIFIERYRYYKVYRDNRYRRLKMWRSNILILDSEMNLQEHIIVCDRDNLIA